MALSASTIIEVRSTGATTNGGGFVTGASGTDYSQQDAAQYALTNGVTDGATAVVLTTSAAVDMIGNIAYLAGGTGGITAGWYQITAASAGVSITVDRATGLTAGTGVTINVGGALSTIALGLALMTVGGMQLYVKATATYSIATGLSTPSGITPGTQLCRIIGYTSTRGDNGKAVIQGSAAITMFTESRGGWRIENFEVDGNTTANNGFLMSGASSTVFNCLIRRMLNYGWNSSNSNSIIHCEVTTCGGATNPASIMVAATGCTVKNNYIHANTTSGIEITSSGACIDGNIIASNTGAAADGFRINASYSTNRCSVSRNVFSANGRDGYRSTATYQVLDISNNIFMNNVGIGLNTSGLSTVRDDINIHHNAYYNSTGTARSGNNAGTGDVTLSGDPFTNSGSGDFSLNNTAGSGAACRSVGYPGVLIGGGTGYADIGALRHQDPATSAAAFAFTFVG